MADQKQERPRFNADEIVISPVTKEDLPAIAAGFYASFPPAWIEPREPAHLRPDYPPADRTLQVRRFATRMQPWLLEPHVHIVKATLSPSSPSFNPADPNRIIGHAAWQMPGRTQQQVVNFWRADAGEKLGWSEKMGWSKEEEDELWSGTDLELWQKGFLEWDEFRERRVGGKGHWFLAPFWVIPEFQGRGVGSYLLKDATEQADRQDPPTIMYLEAAEKARPVYQRWGFEDVEGDGAGTVMVRWGPTKGAEAATA